MPNLKTAKTVIFTPAMRAKGLEAFTSEGDALIKKAAFFKAIKSRVTAENLKYATVEFMGIAAAHIDNQHGCNGRLIKELANRSIANNQKIKGCKLTMLNVKKSMRVMVDRWAKSYKAFLITGYVDGRKKPLTDAQKANKKRTTGGATVAATVAATPAKPEGDSVELDTPITKTIQYVSNIPKTMLQVSPFAAPTQMQAEIEQAAKDLLALLDKVNKVLLSKAAAERAKKMSQKQK